MLPIPGQHIFDHGKQICGTNSWSYTRLGKIDGATAANVREFLNGKTISLTIALNQSAGIGETDMNNAGNDEVYDLKGNPVAGSSLSSGVYIINGKKALINR